GLRLVLTTSVPGPWGESAKALFHVKGIPHVRVAQEGGGTNEALVAWTGERNAPQAVLNDEKTCSHWRDIIDLAERMQTEPALCPSSAEERETMFGFISMLADENGLGWQRRLMLFGPMMALPEEHPGHQMVAGMAGQYGYSPEAEEEAPRRVIEILEKFSQRHQDNLDAGRGFLMGDSLSALDLYWAAFAALLEPLPESICPMPEMIRASYLCQDPGIRAALHPGLLEHRDAIYEQWLEVPLDLGT
ncbi:MAG: hypothetical protein VX252_14245, partial [Myxococcota bacterium]|nr:hypothetical protein [Myxococcota bacterium]